MKPETVFRNCIRYVVSGAPDRRAILDTVAARAFVRSKVVVRQVTGWCDIEDMTKPPIDATDDVVAFALRVDTRKISPAVLRTRIAERHAAWKLESGRERVPPDVRDEIRTDVEDSLLREVLAVPKAYPVIWNVEAGWLTLSGATDAVAQTFTAMLKSQFPDIRLERAALEAAADGQEGFYSPLVDDDFLVWLQWRHSAAEAEWRVAGKVKAAGATLSGLPLMAVLSQDVEVTSGVFAFDTESGKFGASLHGLTVRGIRLPSPEKGDASSEASTFSLDDAADLYSAAYAELEKIAAAFSDERERVTEQHRMAVRRWIGAGLNPVASFLESLRESGESAGSFSAAEMTA